MNMATINWLAVVAAALSAFILGGLWYGPLFGKAWMRENNFTEEYVKAGNKGKIFGFSFLWSLVMSVNLAMFLNAPGTTLAFGVGAGFAAGFGWVAMGMFISGLFERRSVAYMLINGGYMTVSLTLMGAILGGWR